MQITPVTCIPIHSHAIQLILYYYTILVPKSQVRIEIYFIILLPGCAPGHLSKLRLTILRKSIIISVIIDFSWNDTDMTALQCTAERVCQRLKAHLATAMRLPTADRERPGRDTALISGLFKLGGTADICPSLRRDGFFIFRSRLKL